jgi:hypothetical protein
MANRLVHPQSDIWNERQGVGVYYVHKLGVPDVQTRQRVHVNEKRFGRVHSCYSSDFEAKVFLQKMASIAQHV